MSVFYFACFFYVVKNVSGICCFGKLRTSLYANYGHTVTGYPDMSTLKISCTKCSFHGILGFHRINFVFFVLISPLGLPLGILTSERVYLVRSVCCYVCKCCVGLNVSYTEEATGKGVQPLLGMRFIWASI